MAWRGSFSVYGEGIRCACGPWSFSCLISIAFARWALVHGAIFLVRGVTLSMAENARRGPHCIGIVFLCQKWRLWGLFFAGWSFAMKSMLPPIRHNVFLTADHSPFLELLTLQKGPIASFSATTPLFGRNGRFGGARCRWACSSPAVCLALRVARRLPFAANLPVLSIVVCRLPLGAWCVPFCLAAAVCPWPLGSVARRFPLALAPFRPRSTFRRLLRAFAIPPHILSLPLLAQWPRSFLVDANMR